jgi:hypothetical protein
VSKEVQAETRGYHISLWRNMQPKRASMGWTESPSQARVHKRMQLQQNGGCLPARFGVLFL